MKALVMKGPGIFQVETAPTPFCGDDEVIVNLKTVAVCGSDPPLLLGKNLPDGLPAAFPHIPGHEGAGVIVECGKNVRGYAVGDRVVVESHRGCGWCENCKEGRYNLCLNFGNIVAGHKQYGFTVPGCFAEYCAVHPESLHKIPEGLRYDHGALTDTVATAFHAVDHLPIHSGRWTLIAGCGPIGLSAVMLCKAKGSRVIALERGHRRELARICGADAVLDYTAGDLAEKVATITGGVGPDVCIDCAGTAESINTAIRLCRRGGAVGMIPIPANPTPEIDVKSLIWDEKKLLGFRGNPNAHDRVLSMMASRTIVPDRMVTHRYPLQDFRRAFEQMVSKDDRVGKILIDI